MKDKQSLLEVSYPLTNYVQSARSVAQILGASWEGDHYIIPPHQGRGCVEAYDYGHLSLMYSRFELHRTAKIGRVYSELKGFIDFSFIIDGASDSFSNEINTQVQALTYGVYITTPCTPSYGIFGSGIFNQQLNILVNVAWLERLLQHPLPGILRDPDTPLVISVHMDPRALIALAQLQQASSEDHYRRAFRYCKALEAVVTTVQFLQKEGHGYQRQAFHPEDIRTILFLGKQLREGPEKSQTIAELATIHSMNRNKLQQLFKAVHGQTINEYRQRMRLWKAHRMLAENRSVGEVGQAVGYTNLSHFSRAFRKQYGLNPSQIGRKQDP